MKKAKIVLIAFYGVIIFIAYKVIRQLIKTQKTINETK